MPAVTCTLILRIHTSNLFKFHSLTLIQQLIPLGLMAVEEILQEEVTHLAGEPYSQGGTRKGSGL